MSGLANRIANGMRRHPILVWPAVTAIVLIVVLLFITIRDSRAEAAMLRADPDSLPADAAAMRFAAARGADIFADHCAACHGAAARGDSTRGVPNLSDRDWLYGKGLVSQIQQIV